MQDVLSSIRKSVDQADTAIKAVQADLVSQLGSHSDAISGGAAQSSPVKGFFSRPVPVYHLGTAGGLGALVPIVAKFFL